MAGRGVAEAEDRIVHPRVFSLNKELRWVPAVDPLHFDKPAIVGVGLGASFGRTLASADSQAVIGLIPAAVGGTSLDRLVCFDERVGAELHLSEVRTAVPGGFRPHFGWPGVRAAVAGGDEFG